MTEAMFLRPDRPAALSSAASELVWITLETSLILFSTEAFRARILVWKAISSIVFIMLIICAED